MDEVDQFLNRWHEISQQKEVPSFTMIYLEGKIVAESHNYVEKHKDVSAHSELVAIQQAQKSIGSRYLNGCILYTSLEPCQMCAGAIILARIAEVVYFASASKYDGISAMTPEQIYVKNHFPKLTFRKDKEVVEKIKNFFKDKR